MNYSALIMFEFTDVTGEMTAFNRMNILIWPSSTITVSYLDPCGAREVTAVNEKRRAS